MVGQAVISAHKNPASSRAIAAATMGLMFLRAARTRNRAQRQALLGCPRPGGDRWGQALLAAGELHADGGAVLQGPGRLDQLGAQVGVAGLGELAAVHGVAAGVLAWDQPAEPHELAGRGEPAPVSDLSSQGQRAQPGDAAVGGQPGDLPVQRRPVAPAGKVGLHGIQLRTSTTAR
jgi:hypothetical protein